MMSTCLGALALAFSLFYSKDVWMGNVLDFLPFCFLGVFLVTFGIVLLKYFAHSSYSRLLDEKRSFLKSVLVGFLGLLIFFLPDFSYPEWRAGLAFLLFFAWIDAAAYDLRAIRQALSFEGAEKTLRKKLSQAIKSRDLSKTLSIFELVMSVSEKVFSEDAPRDVQKSVALIIDAVDQVVSALPQMRLPVGEKEMDSLLDRYFLFQAVVSKKLETLAALIQKAPSDMKWDLLIKLLSKMSVLFGSIYENFGGPFFLTLGEIAHYLQTTHSQKEMDVYAGCVEAIKSLLRYALEKKKSIKPILDPFLIKLELFMKERFRRDRTINAVYLMQPFAEIGEFLGRPEFDALIGRDELMSDLKRVLSQFAVLETISERMGETGQTDTSSSYHQDLPFLKKTGNELPEEL